MDFRSDISNSDVEVWVDVPFNTNYMVSTCGRVYSKSRYVDGKLGSKRFVKGRIMKGFYNQDGYVCVEIGGVGISVHRLVAMAFLPNEDNKKEVNHKDRVRDNNHLSNLEWVTLQENQAHSWDNGRVGTMLGKSGILHNRSNPIVHMVNGEIVGYYGSIKEAARVLGVADCVIGQAIKRDSEISKKSHKLYGSSFKKI